jgi:hypothetical protein
MKQLKLICAKCRGSGWLCDEHPLLPWEHDHCDGVGVACACNALGAVPRADVFVEFDEVNESAQ